MALAAVCALAALLAACLGAARAHAASGPQKTTLYSIATQEAFNNHKDDRARGKGNNPFGNYKDTTTPTKEGGVGPFAGDRAQFTFKVYQDANLKKAIGSATFLCHYTFNKNAFCNAAYLLNGGTLIGLGFFNFNASTFSVAITGGTGKFRGMRGDVQAVPAVHSAQRLLFTLT